MKPDHNDHEGRPSNSRGRGGRGPRWDGPRGRSAAEPVPTSTDEVKGWLAGRLPASWFTSVPNVQIDRDEMVRDENTPQQQLRLDMIAVQTGRVGIAAGRGDPNSEAIPRPRVRSRPREAGPFL